MRQSVRARIILFTLLTLAALVYLTPNFVGALPEWWNNFLPASRIQLGLDLQGGTHLVLEVKVDKALENNVERIRADLIKIAREKGVSGISVEREGIQLHVKAPAVSAEQVRGILKSEFGNLAEAKPSQTVAGATDFYLTVSKEELRSLRDYAVDQTLETIRNRIDQFGVSEPIIQRHGENSILVQLPGIQDPERAKEIIGKTALLEFKLVDDNANVEDAIKNGPPPGRQLLYGQPARRDGIVAEQQASVVESRALMTGEYIQDARVRPAEQLQGASVELISNQTGARLFEQITAANVKRRLAIVLDNRVYSAPVIQERIAGGRASITGNFDLKEARDLAIVLRAGALPAPVEIVEERTVGPSLGKDSIREGVTSFIVGGLLVMVFMIAYYKQAGLLAVVAVVHEYTLHVGVSRRLSSRFNLARHRRYRAHSGYGGRCQRFDQRTYSRRVESGAGGTLGDRSGLQKCLAGDPGLQRDNLSFGRHTFSIWHRTDQRIRRHALRRYPDDRHHRRLLDAHLLRLPNHVPEI